jgi:hypothetical protein
MLSETPRDGRAIDLFACDYTGTGGVYALSAIRGDFDCGAFLWPRQR